MKRNRGFGSERPIPNDARVLGAADPLEEIRFSFVMRRSNIDEFRELASALDGGRSPQLSRESFKDRFGATDSALSRIAEFAKSNRFTVIAVAFRRTVTFRALVKDVNSAFEIELLTFRHQDRLCRGFVGQLLLDEDVEDVVDAVLGLDSRSVAFPCHRGLIRGSEQSTASQANAPLHALLRLALSRRDDRAQFV